MKPTHKIESFTGVKNFLFGGKATITLESGKTGKWFTYKVCKHKSEDIFFVKVLQGPNNEDNYGYMGTIFNRNQFRKTAKSRIGDTAPSYLAFDWFLRNVVAGTETVLNFVNVYHSNICGRCGRKLTTPESVLTGFGPECSSMLGVARVKSNKKLESVS